MRKWRQNLFWNLTRHRPRLRRHIAVHGRSRLNSLTESNQCIPVNAGRNVRHFTFISDAVEGFIYAYGSGEKLLNVANPEETSVYDFALEVEKYKPLEIVIDRHKRDFDRKEQTVDESIPTVPLQYVSVAEGIRRCLEHETAK